MKENHDPSRSASKVGIVDSATTYELIAYLSNEFKNDQDRYSWAVSCARDITALLLYAHHFKVAPSPSPTVGEASGGYGLMSSQMTQEFYIEPFPPSKVAAAGEV
jgi:hypothetical protein